MLAAALVPACATTLPGGDLGESDTSADAGSPALAVLPGCMPFHALAGVDAVTGGMRSITEPDGSVLFIADDAVAGTTDVPALALSAPASVTVADCLAAAIVPGTAPASAVDPPTLTPLSGVTVATTTLLYYVDPTYGSVGVSAQSPTDGLFRPIGSLLWTFDRPEYGTAAVASGGDIYAIGCISDRFLDADCYVAQVASAPSSSTGDESQYGYYIGAGAWSPRVDDAWPVTSGGTAMDVAWLAGPGRWLMAFVSPLGTTIEVRSGLTPEGPWSAPISLGTCDLADPDMFCGNIHLHPQVAVPAGSVALSYAAASLSSDVASRQAAEPDKWWPRVVALTLPTLP
jgi:hypothetical protein